MRIDDDHMYAGAALIQIAENSKFTAINSFRFIEGVPRNAFRINDNIGIYIKYAERPNDTGEYVFTFREPNLNGLYQIKERVSHLHVALVCVEARGICTFPYDKLLELIDYSERIRTANQFCLYVAFNGKMFHVYVNSPSKRYKRNEKPVVCHLNDFPDKLFE